MLIVVICALAFASTTSWAQISEGFESGLPSSYNSTLTAYTLSSGSWLLKDVIAGTTGVNGGTKSAQIRSATSAQMITPTVSGGVGTISFYVTASTASGAYQVNVSTDNGASFSPAPGSPFTIGTTKTLKTIAVNDSSVNRIQIYRTGATIYIDDFSTTAAVTTYTVTYNANGGTGTQTDSSSPYASGATVTVLGTGSIARTGYTFANWNTVADGSGTSYSAGNTFAIATNTTLYAQWTPVYTVTYSGNGSTSGAPPSDGATYTNGATVTVQANTGSLAQTGHTFAGWNTQADGNGTDYAATGSATFTMGSANVTLYAKWTINTYTVTYDGNGSDGGTAPVDGSSPYNYNSTVTVLGAGSLTKSGNAFTGWNTQADGNGTSYGAGGTFSITANTTLYAQWGSSPTITVGGTLAAVDTTYGTASPAPTDFTLSGVFLTGPLTVTPPSGYEVSLSSDSGYTASLPITASGTMANTTVYVRLAATTAYGTYSGNITVSGGGAAAETIATTASSVAKKALTISGLTGDNKPYDGNTTATFTGTPAYVGLENGESFAVSGTATAAFLTKTAATGKTIGVSGYTAPSANYSVTQPTLTGDITPLALTATGATVTSKPFDGTTNATITGATLVGVISPDVVTVSGGGYFADTNAAMGIAVTAGLTLGGADAGNYSLVQPTGLTGDITQATQTISFAALADRTIGDAPFSLGATASSGLPVTYASSTPTVATVLGNTGTIVGVGTTTITASQAGNQNYTAAVDVLRTLVVGAPLVAGWDFQTTTSGGTAITAAPGSPTTYTANFGSGTIYLDGSYGSSSWTSLASNPQLTGFGGTAVNAATGFSATTTSPACLGLANSSANGQRVVFKFSMTGRAGLVVSYATQRTSTGFNAQLWEYSTDGATWITAETVSSIPSSFAVSTLASITGLDGASTAYLRLTVSGASSASGNNRLDNFQFRALNNNTPVANDDVTEVQLGAPVTIVAAKLLVNDTDADGDTLTITGASATSGTASVVGGDIQYTPPASGSSDTITYTISDGHGATDTAIITVTLLAAPNEQGFNKLAVNGSEMTYLGIPGQSYVLEHTESLSPASWAPVITNQAAPNGYLQFTNSQSGFFRTRHLSAP